MSGTGSIKGGFAGGMRRPKARDILFNKLPPGSGLKAEAGPGEHSKDGWFPFLSPITHGRGGGVRVCMCVGMWAQGQGRRGHPRMLFSFVEVENALMTLRPHGKSDPPPW